MSVRDLALEENRMKKAGQTSYAIHSHIVATLVNYSGIGSYDNFEISADTGETIKFDGKSYSYVPQ